MYNNLKQFFDSGNTLSYQFRINQLKNLKINLKKYEIELLKSLKVDLNKPSIEFYSGELGFVYNEINFTIKNLKRWMKKHYVTSSLSSFPSQSYTLSVPRGVVLIISPWNYPLQLVFAPLIGSIAAGNCSVIKPSEFTPAFNEVLNQILSATFSNNYITIQHGEGSIIIPQMLKEFNFNYVFFTGSINVGKEIAKLCANSLIPYSLELGGKSPVIVDQNVDLDIAVKRIAWGKFFNAGQTCVAPDYVIVDSRIKHVFIEKLIKILDKFYLNLDDDLAKIINKKRFEKLCLYLNSQNIIYGGKTCSKKLQISPTLIDEPSLNNILMQEEIFGPILPILSYNDRQQLLSIIELNPNPLSLYIYSKNKNFANEIIEKVQFGGACINTCLFHLTNSRLPFGGIMLSGQGSYHGKYSFDSFSHKKSIVNMSTKIDFFLKYPPYNKFKLYLIKKLFK